MDLGGMGCSGISCFAYPRLVEALGLPPRPPRVHDIVQMLALPDLDVLDALDCDVVTVFTVYTEVTNAFEEPQKWSQYDFGGRLQALVRRPQDFRQLPDGTIEQGESKAKMPPQAYVFDIEHAGQGLDYLDGVELPLMNLSQVREDLKQRLPRTEEIRETRELCERTRNATDRAVFFDGLHAEIAIHAHGGIGVFPVICLIHPDYVAEYHDIMIQHTIEKIELTLPEVAPYIDIVILASDDWGTQQTTIASPAVFRDLFLPYYKRANAAAHRCAPPDTR